MGRKPKGVWKGSGRSPEGVWKEAERRPGVGHST